MTLQLLIDENSFQKYDDAFVVRVHHETDALYQGLNSRVQEDSPESLR